jgi:hypothetical protein
MAANLGAPSGAPLARLRGIRQWQVGAIQADGQRWLTLTWTWLDDEEPVAVTLDPQDAEKLGKALYHYSRQIAIRDTGDQN